MSGIRFQSADHGTQDFLERFDRNLALVTVQYLDKARHVGSLEVVGQIDVHIELRHGMLGATAFYLPPRQDAGSL